MSSHLASFLSLPYELRFEIYELVLDQRLGYFPRFYLSIASVNRQIRQEVLPIVLQNSRYFSSLEKLSDWTSRGDPSLLKQIQNVTVHMFEDSLWPVADALAGQSKDSAPNAKTAPKFWKTISAPQIGRSSIKPAGRHSLRTKILSALGLSPPSLPPGNSKDAITSAWDAFTAINEVKKLWILFKDSTHPSNRRSFPVEQKLILDIIAKTCQRVQELTIFSDFVSLDYLGHFQDLRQLRFSGYSKSGPEATLKILQSLKKLDTMIVYRYPESYDIDHSIVTSQLPEHLSLTPHVIDQMNPLKHFQVSHMSSALPSQHVTIPIIQALRSHLPTLCIFQLSSDFPLTEDIAEELLSFLAESQITDLKIRVKIPKKYQKMDTETFFPKTCKGGEASTRDANSSDLVHLAMTASGACHHITHVNRMCICEST